MPSWTISTTTMAIPSPTSGPRLPPKSSVKSHVRNKCWNHNTSDYLFEPVNAQVKKGNDVIVSVRLKHKPTGKMVSDAVIAQTRIDMAPEGMAEMSAPLTAVKALSPACTHSRQIFRCKVSGS
jgi:hypothetical protein